MTITSRPGPDRQRARPSAWPASFRLGTLGSELTFAGQAALAFRAGHPDLETPAYFPTMDDVVAAVLDGRVDGGLLTSETSHTAVTDTFARVLGGDRLFVAAEVIVPYRCALLGRPGTALADIRQVGGHGSIRQCRRFLAEQLPGVRAEMHRQNSVEAAREVLHGDGTRAVIGTEATAARFGLEILAHDIDDGSVGAWWVLTDRPRHDSDATHLALLADGSDRLDAVLTRAREQGLRPRTVTNGPTGELFRYRYLVILESADGVPLAPETADAFDADPVGAFTSVTVTP
ncbi:hypothetical protein OG601_46210 [Streptomyces sp. NBC_01239]|uniref:prephenate dehydratase domain-containing protein n=1 Tax=Streptomyces sp. NBC_01239 TaxID=2903792 RepID=UPI00225B443F|nr:prephenate dehydratase domain-containing protein [Streptomyces sp. NBC_01239]MCX4817981.1 hypothetical protein [Streptomyces sp. NBC_01239]